MSESDSSPTPRQWRFKRLVGILFVLVGLVICWLLIGVSFNISQTHPLQQLQAARAVWRERGSSNYHMKVGIGSFGFIGFYDVVVRENRVVSVNNQPPADPPNYSQSQIKDLLPKSMNDYTLDKLFDFAASKLKDEPIPPLVSWCGIADQSNPWRMRYEATYNGQLGHIQSLVHTNCVRPGLGGGLLCPVISHCDTGLRVQTVELLPGK